VPIDHNTFWEYAWFSLAYTHALVFGGLMSQLVAPSYHRERPKPRVTFAGRVLRYLLRPAKSHKSAGSAVR
jgi:hypothetical protein